MRQMLKKNIQKHVEVKYFLCFQEIKFKKHKVSAVKKG